MKTTQVGRPRKSTKHPGGRPTVMTEEVIRKLEEVFAIGGTDEEACFYADIGKTALYEYQQANPKFTERKEALKQRPVLKARQTVVKSLEFPQHAQWYLARKRKDEFSERSEVTGKDGESLLEAEKDPLIINLTLQLNEIYRGTDSLSNGRTPSALGTQTQDKE